MSCVHPFAIFNGSMLAFLFDLAQTSPGSQSCPCGCIPFNAWLPLCPRFEKVLAVLHFGSAK